MQNTGLNSRAHGNNFIRINTFVWLFAKEFGHFLNHFWHTGHTANQNDFINVTSGQTRVFQRRLAGFDRRFDQVTDQGFQFRTCQFHDHMQRLACFAVHRNKRLVDFCLAGRRQFDFRFFRRFFKTLQRHFVRSQINAIFFFEFIGKVVHDAHIEIFATQERIAVC